MGIITALGADIQTNWSGIKAGVSGIKKITSFDSSRYRAESGGEAEEFTPASLKNLRAARLDRASRLLIHTVREALSDAGILNLQNETDVLLSLGTTLGGMLSGQAFHREALRKGLRRARLSLTVDYLAHHQPAHLFREFQMQGDSMIFSNACASGTNAVGYAFHSIRKREYDIAICGGYDTMSEFTFAGFNSLMAVTPALCRPFDKHRDGLALGEGAGILVLEALDHALQRNAPVFAEVAGYGESADAYHMTSPEPSGMQASRAINNALRDAGYPAVDYINAHGTGTKFNDIMEARAIAGSLGDKAKTVPVSSIKPMIGHLLGGAGAVEAIVSVLSIIHKTIPPNLNYETPDPECDLNIVRETMQSDVRTALSNSFGFGGVNASIIFREYPWEN